MMKLRLSVQPSRMECPRLASAVTVEKEGSQGTPYQTSSSPPFSNSGFFNRCVQDDVGAKIREPLDKFFNDTPGTPADAVPAAWNTPISCRLPPELRDSSSSWAQGHMLRTANTSLINSGSPSFVFRAPYTFPAEQLTMSYISCYFMDISFQLWSKYSMTGIFLISACHTVVAISTYL